MVSIRGGIPSTTNNIWLSDIVISYPTSIYSSVLQYNIGKINKDRKLTYTGLLNNPPRLLLAAVNKMRTNILRKDPHYPSYIEKAIQKNAWTCQNFN
jgi:hypothetical protein